MHNENFLKAAEFVGFSIVKEAIWHEKQCNWMGYMPHPIDHKSASCVYGTLGGNFYDGTSGIAYFLGYLAQVTGDDVFKKHAMGAIEHAIAHVDTSRNGAEAQYTGSGGVAMVAYSLGKLFNNESLITHSISIVDQLIKKGVTNCGADIINGPPGIIPFLIKMNTELNVQGLKEYIYALSDLILSKAEKNKNGDQISWNTGIRNTQNLTGYAHGVSGFIHALTEVYSVFPTQEILNVIQGGINYEAACFDSLQQNWPDFRLLDANISKINQNKLPCMTAWCHGAPGIGMARLRMYEIINNQECKQDALTATKKVISSLKSYMRDPFDFSLCHGAAGNADLLIDSYRLFNNMEDLHWAAQLGEFGYRNFISQNIQFTSGQLNGSYTPCLMTGLAGIGYFYLRLNDPLNIPSVLLIKSN